MPAYRYKAVSADGATVRGRLTAPSEDGLRELLERDRVYLLSSRTERARTGTARGIRERDLAELTNNLASLVDAGIPIDEALTTLATESTIPKVRRALDDVREQINEGASLSQALGRHRRMFPDLYQRTVRIGEHTGSLTEVLRLMVGYLEWRLRLRGEILQATLYPAVLIVIVVAVVTLLMTYVVPRFQSILTELDIPMPGITLTVLGISDYFVHRWYELLVWLAVAAAAFVVLRRIPAARLALDGLGLRLPLMGPFLRAVSISRFVKNLHIAYSAGVDILTCLDLTEQAVGNMRYRAAVRALRERVQAGGSLAGGIRESGLFPERVVLMMEVGERAARLEAMLERIGRYYDEDIPRRVRRFMALFEPALIIVLGGIVLTVALSVILPVYQMNMSQMLG